MLDWINRVVAKRDNISDVIKSESLSVGVNAELYKLTTLQSNYVVRRSKEPANKLELVQILHDERVKAFLPQQHDAWLEDDYVYSIYCFVSGSPMTTFEGQTLDVFKKLECLHSIKGVQSTASIYQSILDEANFICDQICETTQDVFTDTVRRAAERVVKGLNEQSVKDLLDNRGVLTHGDFKPFNCIASHCKIQLIDWDKACSISPEFEVAYALFTGKVTHVECKISSVYNKLLLQQAIEYLSDMYLVRDFFRYYITGMYGDYVKYEVFPLYRAFQKSKEKLKDLL